MLVFLPATYIAPPCPFEVESVNSDAEILVSSPAT